jgi:hypothetical protein
MTKQRPFSAAGMIARALVFAMTATVCAAVDVRALIPLYSYPSWYAADYPWTHAISAASNVPVTVIVNANNGPNGGPPNSDYVHGLADLRRAGVTILGYVYTSYGARAFASVTADIDFYDQHWNIHGIFLDEVASTTNQLPHYGRLYDYIKSRTNLSQVVINPGTHTAEGYFSRPACDTAILYEDSAGWTNYVADAYVAGYPPTRFAMLLHGNLTAAAMRQSIDLAARRNIGWVFVTDDVLPNPWDAFPAWWNDEVEYIRELRAFQFTGIAATGATVTLHFNTVTDRTVLIESSVDLSSWGPLTNIAGRGTSTNIVTDAAAVRFFRARF